MKKLTVIPMMLISILALSMPVFADTTVTVNDNKVTIDRNQPNTTTVIQQTVPQMVVVQQEPVIVTTPVIITRTEDPRKLEGEIIRVNIPANQIVVRDINSRERKVLLKQGMISTYKVDDYVRIYLMADLKEAKTIETLTTADLDGEITSIDYTNNVIIVRENGRDSRLILRPGIAHSYKVGDHVRLYVLSPYAGMQEAQVIRVR